MNHMNISVTGATVLDWFFTAIGIALTVGRYIIRYRDQKCLYWDDFLHFMAVICGLGSTIAMQVVLQIGEEVMNGIKDSPSPTLLVEFLQVQSAQSVLFFTCIYSIKAAFLAFYRQLFGTNEWFVRMWWLISIFTMASYIASVTGSLTLCGPAQDLGNLAFCSTPQAVSNEFRLIYYSTILNILTDICIMILPIYMLRSIQIPRRQKIGLGILFSLGNIIIAFELLRFFEFLRNQSGSGTSLTMPVLWSVLETSIAIIVSCLPTYRTLLDNKKKQIARRSYIENVNGQPPFRSALSVGNKDSLSTVHTNDTPEFSGDVALPAVLRGPESEFV